MTNCKTDCKREYDYDGKQVTVFVKNINELSETNDYVIYEQVKNGKTFRMTYALYCK